MTINCNALKTSVNLVNIDDINDNFWNHMFMITVSMAGIKFLINATCTQDAFDTLIDYLADEDNHCTGLLFGETEDVEFPEDYISGGNAGRTLSTYNVYVQKL